MPIESVVVCSLMPVGGGEVLRELAQVPSGVALIELRGDRMERDALRRALRGAERPLIVTLRSVEQGGCFRGEEASRVEVLREALDLGAAFVDVELGTQAARLAEGPDADRVVLSHHGGTCDPDELASTYAAMKHSRAARLKIVPRAASLSEAVSVRRLLARAREEGRALACFAEGRMGAVTRLLAPVWGSWASYGCLRTGKETAPGQFTVTDLLDLHGVLEIAPQTLRYALVGHSVFRSPSPAMHRAGYRAGGLDARYLPVEVDTFDDFLSASGPAGLALAGFAVTMPFKEAAARCARPGDRVSELSRAVNTVRLDDGERVGFSTDGPAAAALIGERIDLAKCRVALLGAGGTARSIAVALDCAGAEVTLFNRNPARARRVASELGVQWKPMEELVAFPRDVLVNATPLGQSGEKLPGCSSPGAEVVLDAVYSSRTTPLIDAARRCGAAAIDGTQLLAAQAARQFEHLTGSGVEAGVMAAAGMQWLDGRGP